MHAQHYSEHLKYVCNCYDQALAKSEFDAVAIFSDAPIRIFQDDMDYPFKANFQFKYWLPVTDNPFCWVVYQPGHKPKLYFYQPVDFWHVVPENPTDFWVDHFDIEYIRNEQDAKKLLQQHNLANTALLANPAAGVSDWGFAATNPETLINHINYYRAYKTDYEQACMREANILGVKGHIAARDTYLNGGSGLDIHLNYLKACSHLEHELPYSNIIGLNQNAAILHNHNIERSPRALDDRRSFLIDAGAQFHGYASDITRTYCYQQDGLFQELIDAMDANQQALINEIQVGQSYVDLHIKSHRQLAELMNQFNIASASTDELIESGITAAFFPHGLGHLIGLQVHDVGGFMQDDSGTHLAAPEQHPFLRMTRKLEPGQYVTIEPGCYVIDSLLQKFAGDSRINWQMVDKIRPYGGVRIEDEVFISESGSYNLTRDLWKQLDAN